MFIYFYIIQFLDSRQKLTSDLFAGNVLMEQDPWSGMSSLPGKNKGTVVVFKVHAVEDQIINDIP